MKYAYEFLKILFISFEFVIVLIIFLTMNLFPEFYAKIGSKFIGDSEIWKYIPVIPFTLASASINYAWKILTPLTNSSNKILYDWPDYWKLKLRVTVSIAICVICLSLAIMLWFFCKGLDQKYSGAMFVGITLIPLTVLFNQLLAAFTVREFLEP